MPGIDAQLEHDVRSGTISYVPRAKLAWGGMAEVWRGEAELSDGRVVPVAFKRVLPELSDSPLYRRLLEEEARIGTLLRHANIVRVYDGRELHGSFVMVMEFVEGASLREIFRHLHACGARIPPAASLRIARSLAWALTAAHEAQDEQGQAVSIVHGDLSPHNVLVAEDGTVKLMDFGLATILPARSGSSTSADVGDRARPGGKPGYLAPESILLRELSPASDLFALGVVLWECLAGQRLFHGRDAEDLSRKIVRCEVPPLSRLVSDLPRELDALLARLLVREPHRRLASARELAGELAYLAVREGRRAGHLQGGAELRELATWATAGVPRRHSEIREPVSRREGEGADLGLEPEPFESERDSASTRPLPRAHTKRG